MTRVETFATDTALIDEVARRLIELVQGRSLDQPFRIALTGGTLGGALLARLSELACDPTGIEIYWGDERWVELDHPDRNEAQALAAWPELSRAQLHRYGSPADSTLAAAAKKMDQSLSNLPTRADLAIFDLVLLGVGPDGHVASLFPGHNRDQNPWVIFETESPKPPPQRLSLSYQALNSSVRVWFLASGPAKAAVVHDALTLGEKSSLPCGQVRGSRETIWFIDDTISKVL